MYRKKIMLPAITLLFILGMSLSACASKETPTAVPEESTIAADMGEDATPAATTAEDTAPADTAPKDAAPADAAATNATPQATQSIDAAPAPKQTPATAKSKTSESAVRTIEGMVSEINSNSIVVNELYTDEIDNGLISVSGTDIFTTVNFTDSTKFTIRTVVNGGINASDSSDSPGTAANLKVDENIIVTAATDSTGLCATEIVIYNFQ